MSRLCDCYFLVSQIFRVFHIIKYKKFEKNMKKGDVKMGDRPKMKFDLDKMFEDSGVASATECTGLIQIPPENEWEEESYKDIYKVPRRGDSDKEKDSE